MSLFDKSISANTPARQSASDLRTKNDIAAYVNTYYDTLQDELEGSINKMELGGMFREDSQTKDTEVHRTKVRGNSTVPLNADGQGINFLTWGQGWQYQTNVYQYRLGVKHTRHLEEIEGVEDVNTITQEADELYDATDRTLRFMFADFWNRSVSPTTSQVLSPDGMFLVDSDRPNPVAGVPNWSNLEDLGDITEENLFEADLNASNQIAHNGDDLPTEIKKIHIPKAYGHVMNALDKTERDVNSALNTVNWAAGRFAYEEHSEFTTNQILYELSGTSSQDNPCVVLWAVRPGTAPINFEDPDVIGERIRFRVGLAIKGDPRKMWRGGLLNAL